MRRIFALILISCLLLSACVAVPSNETTVAETETSATPTDVTEKATEAPTEPATEETEPQIVADSLDDYEYVYHYKWDRAWEEDIIFLAQTVLGRHPKVYEDYHWIATSKDWGKVYTPENPYYDISLRNEFIAQIRELIKQIPKMSNTEIHYELMRIVALLNDAHSSVFWVQSDLFPLMLKVLYDDSEAGIYVVKAPKAYEDLMYTRLVSINGIPVKDIVYKLMDYVPSENEYLSAIDVIDYRSNSILMWVDALCEVGVLEDGERTAEIMVLDGNGEYRSVSLDAVTYEEYQKQDLVSGVFTAEEYMDCRNHAGAYYWYTRLEEENTYYLRISAFRNNEDYPFTTYFNDIMLQLYAVEEPQKVIIDLRGNGGGKVLWQWTNDFFGRLDGANTNGVYILVDELSCSASVIMSSQIKNSVNDVVIVGAPAGQPPNFFTGQVYETLPNYGLGFQISAYYALTWQNYEYDALMPDIAVYQTLEDYMQGIDTVLEAVRNMK